VASHNKNRISIKVVLLFLTLGVAGSSAFASTCGSVVNGKVVVAPCSAAPQVADIPTRPAAVASVKSSSKSPALCADGGPKWGNLSCSTAVARRAAHRAFLAAHGK